MPHTLSPHSSARRPPGRPRSPRADRAILDATLELLAAEGFGRLSVEGVASLAGVGKATIYRRWGNKLALVLAAVGELSAHPLPEVTTGSTRDDLVALLRHMIESLTTTIAGRILPGLIAETSRSPELLGVLEGFWLARRRLMLEVLRKASDQGDLSSDIDYELIADLLYGPVHYRFLMNAAPVSPDLAGQLVDTVMSLATTRPAGRGANRRVATSFGQRRAVAPTGKIVDST